MNILNKFIFLGFISLLSLVMTACNDKIDKNVEKEKIDSIWKTQTDALQSAKDTAKKLQQNLNQQQEKLDENN